MVRDELHRDAYETVHAAGDLSALWAHHQRRAQHLAEFHGPPAKVDATPKGLAATVERAFQRQEEARPGAGKTSLLEADDHTYFAADARIIHPDVPRLVDDADARMRSLGFVHVGDVVGTFLTDCLVRGYARQGGDAWALLQINASTIHPPAASWDFVTRFEKGAVLSSTRGALSKDEPKRKIFRILDATASPEELLARHDARKGELAKKWGAPVAVTADMKTLAAEVADIVRRFIG
jgi:hypothetical protein